MKKVKRYIVCRTINDRMTYYENFKKFKTALRWASILMHGSVWKLTPCDLKHGIIRRWRRSSADKKLEVFIVSTYDWL